jgi:hypothetical protein
LAVQSPPPFNPSFLLIPAPDYCSNAVTCNGVTVFVTIFVFFGVFDYIFKRGIVTGIKYKIFEVFRYLLSSFFKYSVLSKNYFKKYFKVFE